MKLMLILALSTAASAQQPLRPVPATPPGSTSVVQYQQRIAYLEAALDAATKTHMADAAACWSDDPNIIQQRFNAAVAQKKAAALAPKPGAAK